MKNKVWVDADKERQKRLDREAEKEKAVSLAFLQQSGMNGPTEPTSSMMTKEEMAERKKMEALLALYIRRTDGKRP